MSHVTQYEFDLDDMDALKAACEEIGAEVRPKKTYKWWGHHVGDYPMPEGFTEADLGKCDFAIGVKGDPNAYEVGVVKKGDKTHLLYDFYAGGKGLMKVVGKDLGLLKPAYSKHHAKHAARKMTAMGFKMSETTNKAGETVLHLRR